MLGYWIKEMDGKLQEKVGRWDNCEPNKDGGSMGSSSQLRFGWSDNGIERISSGLSPFIHQHVAI